MDWKSDSMKEQNLVVKNVKSYVLQIACNYENDWQKIVKLKKNVLSQ